MKCFIMLILTAVIVGCSGQTPPNTEVFCPSSGVNLALSHAKTIASQGCPNGTITSDIQCNENTGTWWFGFVPNTIKENCNPACVVAAATKTAEINWRCTGVLAPITPLEPTCVAPSGETMSLSEAKAIASNSNCSRQGTIGSGGLANNGTATWWLDFTPTAPKTGCNPACVVDIISKTASVNWRCTGLIAPPEESCNAGNFTMTLSDALKVAKKSACVAQGTVLTTASCAKGTWNVDFKPFKAKSGCNPICVVNLETKKANLDWGCNVTAVP